MGWVCKFRGSRQRIGGRFRFDVSIYPPFYERELTSSSIANAFTKVVTSFVSDLVLPIVSLLPFLNRNMDQKFAVLSKGPNFASEGYNTLHQAREDGALVLAYGYVHWGRVSKSFTRDSHIQ